MIEMVRIEDGDSSCSVLIVLKQHTDDEVEVYTECVYTDSNIAVTGTGMYHDSVETAVLKYKDTANYLHLEGIGMPQYNIDTLSSFSNVRSIYIGAVTVPRNQSSAFFTNSTVRQLQLFMTHGIADMGPMPLLNSVTITSCVMDRLPDFNRTKYPHLASVDIVASAILNQSTSDVWQSIYLMRTEGITVTISGSISIG